MYDAFLLDDAEIDLDEAYIWYDLNKEGLGDSFFNSINESILAISRQPFTYHKVYKNIRRYIVKKFPYGIYYNINVKNNSILIIGILHFKRNSDIIKGRI